MRVKRTVLCGFLAAGLLLVTTATAWAGDGNWDVVMGDWMVGASWAEGAPPSAGKAYIRNGGTAILSSTAPNITEFDIESGSIVVVGPGASLTGTTGNWKVGDNGESGLTGTLIQTGGDLKCASDLYLGDDADDWGEYWMSGGSMKIGDDLKLGDDGKGLFVLSGTGQLTVDGYIAISGKAPTTGSDGTFEISGGTLTQVGVASGSGNARLTVSDEAPGTLRLIGGNATINVSNFEMEGVGAAAEGTFEAVMNGSGISTINCVGVDGGASYMDLAGDLIVSFADGDPPPLGSYDLIVADSRVGEFLNITAPPTASVTYETGSEIVRITVVPEPSTLLLAAVGLLALVPFLRRYRKT